MAKMKKTGNNKCLQMVDRRIIMNSVGIVNMTGTLENSLVLSTKIECEHVCKPAIPILGIKPAEIHNCMLETTHMSLNNRGIKLWYFHKMVYST